MSETEPTRRLIYLVSHPIQYQAPLLRRIADEPGIELEVLFETLVTSGAYHDAGFGREVDWDVPLTKGYVHHHIAGDDELPRHLNRADALWVHGWDSQLRRRALTMATELGLPTLMRGENTDIAMPDGDGLRSLAKGHYLKTIFKRCSGFLCIGTENRRYYSSRGVAEECLFSMPYAVDNASFAEAAAAAAPGREHLRAELGLAPQRPVVMFAGKLLARKHPLTLLRAWQELPAEVQPYLLYVGDGEERPALEAAIGNDQGVRFLGFRNQTELPALYDLADIFVLASEREPWGLAINEAMACGTAVVVSDQCGCAVDLVGPESGRVVPAGDVGALSLVLNDMLSTPEKLTAMGEAAQTRISCWDFEADVAGLREALNALCGEPRPA